MEGVHGSPHPARTEEDGSTYLNEAMARFPDSSMVQLSALILDSELNSDDRVKWANRLKDSMPENSIANVLAAHAI